jgi:hypothetical protein
MAISRRKFIGASVASLLVVGGPVAGLDLVFGQGRKTGLDRDLNAGDIPYAAQQDPVFFFRQETFTPYVNSNFVVRGQSGRAGNFKLIGVDGPPAWPKNNRPANTVTTSFSLFFTSGKRTWPQDEYQVTHDALGTFSLLIVPIVSRNEPMYQAVINHLN